MSAVIEMAEWLTAEELEVWVNEAPTRYEYRRRLAISLAVRFRMRVPMIANMLLVDETTVRRWFRTYNELGPESLEPDHRGGRRESFLSLEEEKELLQSLHQRAEQGEFVTLEQLRGDVETRVHHPVSTSYLTHLIHRHGWRKLVPRPRHPKSDPVRLEQFRKDFPSLVNRAVRSIRTHLPIRVLFEDEATFGRISEMYSSWVPPKVRPLVAKQQVREYVNVMFASSPFDGKSISSLSKTLDHHVVGRFLGRIAARFAREFCIVFLDRSGPHTDKELKVPQRVLVEFLPPKSPELNPEEHIWDHLREKHFGNRLFPSMERVTTALRHGLRLLAYQPELVRSMTAFPWIVDRAFW